jgi:hypothetical protein
VLSHAARDAFRMVCLAPRLSPRLLSAIERIDDGELAIAEVWRRVRAEAATLDVPAPSYERVRSLVREHRRCEQQPTTAAVLAAVALRTLPPRALVRHVAGLS